MKDRLVEVLICPLCVPDEHRLRLSTEEREGKEVLQGTLQCPACGIRFAIREGVARLIPESPTPPGGLPDRYETPALLAVYLWGHYADLLEPESRPSVYTRWCRLLDGGSGHGLDTGCSVGRFTFELASKCNMAIGLDYSERFIRAARTLLLEGGLTFELPMEGHLTETRTIRAPDAWDRSRVEFIVADAHTLPFPSDFFGITASLNLADKLRHPMVHLEELNRVSRKKGSQFLFSDPFSWSSETASEDDWLGGKWKGAYSGRGSTNVQRIVSGADGVLNPGWTITGHGYEWWKLRTHENHYESIRSWFLKAER